MSRDLRKDEGAAWNRGDDALPNRVGGGKNGARIVPGIARGEFYSGGLRGTTNPVRKLPPVGALPEPKIK